MPLLPPEPNLFPPDLFAETPPGPPGGPNPPTDTGATDRAWWVLHTKPRQEKSIARQLLQARVPFYLPVIPRRCPMRHRVLHSHVPLFPGYVFLLADRAERVTALATGRVVRTLEVFDQPTLWHDLGQVYRLIAAGAPITPEARLAPGTPVVIRTGPLAGLKGKILRTASGQRFVVQVDFIQQGASVLLDDFRLAPAEEESPALQR
jgi:transcriptional antiterminator RfaH